MKSGAFIGPLLKDRMKTFNQFKDMILESTDDFSLGTYILSEEIHKKIQDAMDSEIDPSKKLNAVTKVTRDLIKKGEDTGLESDKPKKGSSRAVFFAKEHKKIEVDGKNVTSPSAVKIAFPGHLDKYNKSGVLLGQQQNEVESDHYSNDNYSVLREHAPGKFKTNPEGILPPHFGHHEDYHHLEMGKVEPINSKDFKTATIHPDFPKGITHQEFHDAVNHNYQQAHGKKHYGRTSVERVEELQDHPLVDKVNEFVGNTDNHPADMNKGNMGLWTHPVTGKKHVVISDFGYSKNVAQSYNDARKNATKINRGY